MPEESPDAGRLISSRKVLWISIVVLVIIVLAAFFSFRYVQNRTEKSDHSQNSSAESQRLE